MVKVSVAVFKQPAAFKLVSVYVPLIVYVVPFQSYELQAVVVMLPFVVIALIVKFKLLVLAHPFAFKVVYVNNPEVV
jgi:hypothetical protein